MKNDRININLIKKINKMQLNLEQCFPKLIIEWDPTNEKKMNTYTRCSNANVKWICKLNPCGCHKWCAVISSRTNNNRRSGCPYCANKKVCSHNNLKALYPALEKEWHPDNLPMESYPPGSAAKAKWICSSDHCGCHIWEISIRSRTNPGKTGCPYCNGNRICDHNNLAILYPHLQIEWHPDNEPMTEYLPGSDKIVKWTCCLKPRNHIWLARIANRTSLSRGCPHCANSKGYSNGQILWLTQIEMNEDISIQHALKPGGEYNISGVGKVDGFCIVTNTVYEYHGDFWHGNPKIYNHNDTNPISKKKYGVLYNKTMERDSLIRKLGYTLIIKWESD